LTLPIRISEEADAEVAEAARWYETHRTGLGVEFLDVVDAAVTRIAETPRMGSPVPGISDRSIRRRPVRGEPAYEAAARLAVAVAMAIALRIVRALILPPNGWPLSCGRARCYHATCRATPLACPKPAADSCSGFLGGEASADE
jgi:hypothetical protein